jgi:hypothetical protein
MRGLHVSRPRWDTAIAATGLATWFAITVLSQHPDRSFDKLRRYDPTGTLIPNWRFFAPEPGQSDNHVMHRVLTTDGRQTSWKLTLPFSGRAWKDFFWFPDRRLSKAIFDVSNELTVLIARGGKHLTRAPSYQLLRNFVARAVRAEYSGHPPPRGFQFAIVRYTGYDDDHEPEYLLVSPFIVLEDCAA